MTATAETDAAKLARISKEYHGARIARGHTINPGDMEWLIDQAGRVAALETERARLLLVYDSLHVSGAALEAENARLRGAMAPFANLLPDTQAPKDSLQAKLQGWCRGARSALSSTSAPAGEGKTIGQTDAWVVRKRGLFYRPNSPGYTADVFKAGHYTEADAKAEATSFGVTAHPLSEFLSAPIPEPKPPFDFMAAAKAAQARFDALTPEQRAAHHRAQRKSWVAGELMLGHPEMSREEAEALVDKVAG